MPPDTESQDTTASVNERLHAAQQALDKAYEHRNALVARIEAVEAEAGAAAVGPDLLDAFRATERAVVAAELETKSAEDALTATEHSVTDREKNIEALRTVCLGASPDRLAQAGRDVWERDLH